MNNNKYEMNGMMEMNMNMMVEKKNKKIDNNKRC